MGGREHKRKQEGENAGTEAKVSRGGRCGGAPAGERKPEGWLCPIIMTIMMVIIIMRIMCCELLVLSVERAPAA